MAETIIKKESPNIFFFSKLTKKTQKKHAFNNAKEKGRWRRKEQKKKLEQTTKRMERNEKKERKTIATNSRDTKARNITRKKR